MSELSRETASGGVAVIGQNAEREKLSRMAVWKLDKFFQQHPAVPELELPGHDRLLFLTLPLVDGAGEAAVVIYEHDKRPNFVADNAGEHERMRTLFVRRPDAQDIDCFEDAMDDEHALEDRRDFAGLIALRATKKRALIDPLNHSPIKEDEALRLSDLLRTAERLVTAA